MFSVTGHTDLVGNVDYNMDLGMRRAQRVVDYLVAAGIQADRLIAQVSLGEEAPVVDTTSREALNRRVVTEVFDFYSDDSGTVATSTETEPENLNPASGPTSDDGGDKLKRERQDSGRGNGDDGGDPGNSGDKNQGGDL